MKHDYQLMNINSLWKIRENWEPLIYLVTGVPFADTSWGIGFAPRVTATHMIEDIMELVTVWKSCLIGNLVKEEVKPGITCKCECVCVCIGICKQWGSAQVQREVENWFQRFFWVDWICVSFWCRFILKPCSNFSKC